MSTSQKQPIVYVLLSFVLIAVGYFVFAYKSPITVVNEQHIEIDRSPRFVELLGKKELSTEEFEELKMESYSHWVRANPGSKLSFQQWEQLVQKKSASRSNP
jgi:hypothetical protein